VSILAIAHTYVRYGTFCMTTLRKAVSLQRGPIVHVGGPS
jgi:hypothetical protein